MPAAQTLSTFDQEDLTIDNTTGGVALTVAKYQVIPPGRVATLIVETAQIRWKKDMTGTLTATTGGFVANVGTVIVLDNGADLTSFRAIRTGATSGKIHVEYSR